MGMVGGGSGAFIGEVHRLAASLDGHIELVSGAFSRDAENNRHTAEQLGVSLERCHDAWVTLIDNEKRLPAHERIDFLSIVTPNHLHVPIAKAAINAGIPVFCEKPAGVSLDEVLELASLVRGRDVFYGLAHTYLGYPMVWQARHMVKAGELGKIRKIIVEYPQGWLAGDLAITGNKQAQWRGMPDQAGPSGCIGDIGVHAFNLAEFVSGQKIDRLCAHLATHVAGRQLDDDGAVLFQTEHGASGVLIASQVCVGEENALKLRLYGDQGGLEWRQEEPNSLIYRSATKPLQVLRAGKGQPWLCEEAKQRTRLPAGHPEGYLEAMANLYTAFAKAVIEKNTDPVSVPGIEAAVRGMAFIESVLASHLSSAKWTPLAYGEK
ncbi:Gfo/Idh/MocA family oxidoreductase (plasmid) [Pseudomonas sp. JZ134]